MAGPLVWSYAICLETKTSLTKVGRKLSENLYLRSVKVITPSFWEGERKAALNIKLVHKSMKVRI